MRMPIAYAINDGYTKPLMAQLVALYEHAKKETIYDLYILNYQLKEENRQLITNLVGELKAEAKVTFLDITDEQYAKISFDHWGIEISYRGLLGDLLPNEKYVLYLDADTLVIEDLTHLMKLDLTGMLYAAVKDVINPNIHPLKIAQLEGNELAVNILTIYDYVNSGVMLFNLDYWRKHNLSQEFLRLLDIGLKNDILNYPDQDVLNYLAIRDGNIRIYYLPVTYNNAHYYRYCSKHDNMIHTTQMSLAEKIAFQAETARRNRSVKDLSLVYDRIVIIHFCGLKPWRKNRKFDYFDAIFQPYADRVGFEIPPREEPQKPTLASAIITSLRGKNIYKLHRKIKVALLFALGVGFVLGLIIAMSMGT